MRVLMDTPGASTDDPAFMKTLIMPRRAGKSTAYADMIKAAKDDAAEQHIVLGDYMDLTGTVSTSASTGSTGSTLTTATAAMKAAMAALTPKVTTLFTPLTKDDSAWYEEAAEISPEDWDNIAKDGMSINADDVKAEMEALTKSINDWIAANQSQVTANPVSLTGPASLTVMKAGSYSKASHIGGEEFVVQSVYFGKRDKILVKFAPTSASAYTVMEMNTTEAGATLTGFTDLMGDAVFGGIDNAIKAIHTAQSKIREAEANKDKFVEYEEIGFGSW